MKWLKKLFKRKSWDEPVRVCMTVGACTPTVASSVKKCGDCGASIWVDEHQRGIPEGIPNVCVGCALARASKEDGKFTIRFTNEQIETLKTALTKKENENGWN